MDTQLPKSTQGGNIDPLSRKRTYCFTDFKPDAPIFTEEMSYLLYAPELCPETQKPHWQCYVVWKNTRTMSATSKALGNVWCRPAEAGIKFQLDYIRGPYSWEGKTKPFNDKWKEFGKQPAQGKRADLDAIKETILTGEKTVDDLVLESPMVYHMYGRTMEKIEELALLKKYRTEMTTCEWLVGETGKGKSHRAFENYSPETHYVLPDDKGWWDGYKGQDVVIINDFRGHITYNNLLQMIDKWPYSVSRRGKCPLPFVSKHVIITSSLEPSKVYHNRDEEDSIAQLLRRVKVVYL